VSLSIFGTYDCIKILPSLFFYLNGIKIEKIVKSAYVLESLSPYFIRLRRKGHFVRRGILSAPRCGLLIPRYNHLEYRFRPAGPSHLAMIVSKNIAVIIFLSEWDRSEKNDDEDFALGVLCSCYLAP